MAQSPCSRQGLGAASPSSLDHHPEKERPEACVKPPEVSLKSSEVSLKSPVEQHPQQKHQDKSHPLAKEPTQKQQQHPSPKDNPSSPRHPRNPDKPETTGEQSPKKHQATARTSDSTTEAGTATAQASATPSNKNSNRSQVFADLASPSTSSSKNTETLHLKLGGSKSRGFHTSPVTISSQGKPTYDKMEALGGSGYPYGASYILPGNAAAYKPSGNMPPPPQFLRGPWPPPNIEAYASLPVGASSLYPPYLPLSGLSPSAPTLGGVSFLTQSSVHNSDGQPIPATVHAPPTDSKTLISHHHLAVMKEKDAPLESPKHHAISGKQRHPALLPPKLESDVSGAMRGGKHDKLVSKEGHGSDSQTRQNQHQTSGKRHVKEELHPPHVESDASSKNLTSASWESNESRTLKRAWQGGGETGKETSPSSYSQFKEKRESGADGPDRKKKKDKKRIEHADENGNSLKISDGKAVLARKTVAESLASPHGSGKGTTTHGLGPMNSMGTVLSVGVESYALPGDMHHASSLLKTVSPPLTLPCGLSEASKKVSPGVSPALSPGDVAQSYTKKHSPKEPNKRNNDVGLKNGKEDKRDNRFSKDSQSSGDKLLSPNSGVTSGKDRPVTMTTSSDSSPTQSAPTISPSNANATVHLGYMPMYLPNTCQLSLDKETNKDAPKSGTKVHATTFVPAPGEFIPGPATNATVGVSAGKDTKCKTSPSLPESSNAKSPNNAPFSKSKISESPPTGKKESPKGQSLSKSVLQSEKCDSGNRLDDKKGSSKPPSSDQTDSGKGAVPGLESKEESHSKMDDNSERRDLHAKKRHVSGNLSGMKHESRSESKADRTSSGHTSGKHNRVRSVSGPDPGVPGLTSPRDYSTKHSDRHSSDKSLEDHRRSMDLRVGHPSLYYDMGIVGDRSRTDSTTLPIPTYHGECFSPSSAAHEAALARHESMLRTALLGSAAHRLPSASAGAPLVSSPSSQSFTHATSISSSHASSGNKKTLGSSSDGGIVTGRGTPSTKSSDGRCPPIGIAVAQQRQDGETQGRHPPRSSSRSASSSPHVSRVLPSSSLADKRDTDDERMGRSRDPVSAGHSRLSEREQRLTRDQSPRESRSSSEIPFHVGAHRRYQHDLSANLVVTGGGSIGRPDSTIHPHLPATPHHWLPRPPSHAGATPSPLWPYGIPSSSSPMSSSTLEASPRGSPFPVGPGGMHWAQDPTTGQLMLVPPHPVHADSPLSNLVWPRYLVPPHLQPHSHQLQQLMLNQFPYGPIPGPAHPSQHPSLLSHIPAAGSSMEVQALLQQQHEAIASMYRQAEQQERSRKEQSKPPSSSDPLKLDSLKSSSGLHRNRRESGDVVKGEVRPESRQSERCRTSSQEPLDIKHSIHPPQSFLQAIPVAPSQHPTIPFMYPPYLYESHTPVSGPPTPSSRTTHDPKDKKDFLPDRSHAIQTQIPPLRSGKDKKEGVLKSTSVQTSPAETPPVPTSQVEADEEEEKDCEASSPSAKVSRTQQTEMKQQKLLVEPNIDVVTVDSPEVIRTSSTPLMPSETAVTQTKSDEEVDSGDTNAHEHLNQTSIQTDVKTEDALSVKEEEILESIQQSDKEETVVRTSSESQCENISQCESVSVGEADNPPADTDTTPPQSLPIPTSTVSEIKNDITTTSSESPSLSIPTTSRESLITNVLTTMQTFSSSVEGLDQDQLAAIEGIALLSEVAEHKAIASRAEFWSCVAEQHRTENSDEMDDAASTTTESNIPLQGNSVSAMTSNGDLDEDDLSGISPSELSLKIRCPITIKKEANGRSEVSACGTPLGSAENMNPMELEMRMKLAELQRKYKEKKKELDKLQKKKDKKAREDSKSESSPTVEKRRGRGRPRKRKYSAKSGAETTEELPKESLKEKEVKSLHSSATVLLEAAASLEEPAMVPKKKKKKEHKIKKELKEQKDSTKDVKEHQKVVKDHHKDQKQKSSKLTKKSKKLKSKLDANGVPLTVKSGSGETKIKKKKDKTGSKHLTTSKSSSDGHMTALKVKGSKSGKKRTGSPIRSDSSSKKHRISKSAKKSQMLSLASHDSLTSDTDSGSIIWPTKATPISTTSTKSTPIKTTPSSPFSASTKPSKSPKLKTKTKLLKKLKSKEGKLGLQMTGKKKKTKSKNGVAKVSSSGVGIQANVTASSKLDVAMAENKLKPGLLISHVYGEDSDSTMDEGSTATTTTSSQPSSWSSHKGLALLAELSSNQSSSCSATPTKAKKKKIKSKTKSLSSSMSTMSDGGLKSKSAMSGMKKMASGKIGKKTKIMKKKLISSSGEKSSGVKKLKKVSKGDRDSKSSNVSSKGEKPKKSKQNMSNKNSAADENSDKNRPSLHTPSQPTAPPAPQFDESSWCRRRSERIFLSDISPVQSRDISPQRKAELAEPVRRKVMQSPPGLKKTSDLPGQGQSSAASIAGLVSQIGSVLDALKTDPLQMRKKLIRLSAQEDEADDDGGQPQDENRRKKLKKKAKKKDKTPQDKLSPVEVSLRALQQELTDSSDSDGENVPLSSLVDRPSTPAPRNCVLSVNELQDGLRVLIPIDGLFHAGNVRAIQPPDVYGVVIEGGRGSRPHVFSQEQILQEAIADVKPSSTRYLPEGTRICAYWSQQYKYLYPGTVVKGSPNPTTDSNFTTVEFDDGDSGRIPLDHIRMLPQDYPLVDFEPSPIMVQRKRRRRPSETSSTTEWKMADDIDERIDGKRREYSWRSQSSKDDAHAISEGDNDVFLPSLPKLKKSADHKSKKLLAKKSKSKLKLKTKVKGLAGQKTPGGSLAGLSKLQKAGVSSLAKGSSLTKLTKLKKKGMSSAVSSKFSQKLLQKQNGQKSFAVKKKSKLASGLSNDGKIATKKKGPKKKIGGGKAKCTVEIETVYSSEVFPDDLDYPEGGLRGPLGSFDSEDSSDDESDHYTKSADTIVRKKKMKKKKKKSSLSSSCNVQAAFSPPRQFWRWLGKATQRRGSKGKARKLFYKSIVRDKEIIRVGECAIFLSTGRPHLPYIGRIESMWESWGGMMVVRVKWFYHPEETKGGRKPNDGKMALYLSQHVDENDVQTISHKCEVLSLDEYKQYVSGKKTLNTIVRAQDIYYLAGTYDPGSGHTVSAN